MKKLAASLILLLLVLSAYLIMGKGDGENQVENGNTPKQSDPELPTPVMAKLPEFEEDELPSEDLGQRDLALIDRSGWDEFRNALERRVPDPDRIGACPPPHMGGWPALVVRRYLDRETGDRIWMHEDGSMTWHHYERSKDPGRKEVIGRWVISTAVPTETGRADSGSKR